MLRRETRALIMLLVLAGSAATATLSATAQEYPEKPIRLVVGYPAGGGVDIVARHVGEEMGKLLGQRMVIENRPGAAGNLATAEVARAPADGYTLMMANIAQLAINPGLYKNLTFDTERDFEPIGQTAVLPFVAVVHNSIARSSLSDVIALIREKPGALNYGSAGAGSVGHLAMEMLKAKTGAQITHVPYRGAAPAVNDLVGGHVQIMIDAEALLAQHVRSGSLKGLAVMSSERSGRLPDIPTIAEAGFPDLVVEGWQGLVAPAGTPKTVLDRLSAALKQALSAAELRERLAQQAVQVAYLGPADFGQLIRKERSRWGELIERAAIKAD